MTLIDLENRKILRPRKDFIKKLTFYCPVSDTQRLKKLLWDSGAGNIGNYSHCSFSSYYSVNYSRN